MTSKVDKIAVRLAQHRQSEQVIISDSLLRLLTRWDDLSAAIDRIVTALPAQMSEASNRLEAERKLMREEITAYTRAEGRSP